MQAAARQVALAALRGCKTQMQELGQLKTRRGMSGHGGDGPPTYMSLNGKPPPVEFQGPDFITYAGLTLPKRKLDFDYYYSKALGAAVWATMAYHFTLNWEEHWYGDIWVFEHDVQKNGWGDEGAAHGHGHGHH